MAEAQLYGGISQPAAGGSGVVLLASAVRTVSGDSGDIVDAKLRNARALTMVLDVTAQSGTTPTLDVGILSKLDNSYLLLANFSRYAAVTGKKAAMLNRGSSQITTELVPNTVAAVAIGTTFVLNQIEWDDLFVCKYIIGGTTPSFTFRVVVYPTF